MSAAGLICPECGSSDIVDDDILVCADCGSVVSEGVLTTDRSEELQGTDVRYSQTTGVFKVQCINQIKGLQRVRALCRVLRLNREIEELAENYFKQAYEHRDFINVSLQKKELLVGCCVLVSCRLRSWPIVMSTISSLLEADPTLMAGIYLDMVKTLHIEAPRAGITDILETYSKEYKISPGLVPEGLSEDHKDLTRRAVALVELAADTWIVTGRSPLPILMAAIFLAWQSLTPTKTRLKYSLERFCKMAKVKKNNTALKRVAEMKEMLCTLGQEIPWLRSGVTPHNVMQEVEDILKYRNVLMRRAMRSHEEALLAENSSTEPLVGSQTDTPSQTPRPPSGQVEEKPNQACEEACAANAEKTLQQGAGDHNSFTVHKEPNGKDSPESQAPVEPHWGKRVLFAPPCVKNAKVRIVERQEGKEVTGDEEISDSEIESYLRTPQEVRDFAATQEMLSSAGSLQRDVLSSQPLTMTFTQNAQQGQR